MSINNPIIPPGSPLQRSHPAKNSKLVLAVSLILTVHVVILAGLLIQGCKRQDAGVTSDQELATNSLPPLPPTTSPGTPVAEQPKPATAPDTASAPTNPSRPEASATPAKDTELFTKLPAKPVRPTSPATSATTDTITPNSATSHLTTPGAATETSAAPVSGTPPNAGQADGQIVYTVKPGDNLTKIARAHGTTVKAIRALNDLKTDRILVAQKIKIPAAGSAPSAAENPTPVSSSPR